METLSALATTDPTMVANSFVIVALIIALIVGLALYLYRAFALMTIARKTDTPLAWLAFIPIASDYLTWRVSRTPLWTLVVWFGLGVAALVGYAVVGMSQGVVDPQAAIPLLIGFFLAILLLLGAFIAILSYWWWGIAEHRGYPPAFGLLMSLPYFGQVLPYVGWVFGIVPLVAIGILAWRDP